MSDLTRAEMLQVAYMKEHCYIEDEALRDACDRIAKLEDALRDLKEAFHVSDDEREWQEEALEKARASLRGKDGQGGE